MWTALAIALVIATSYITSRVCAHRAKQTRDHEERQRRERRRALSALETKYLEDGYDSCSGEFPEEALYSLGNIAYLIWLLNYEPRFRNYRGDGKNPYPPDWEWRRRFVFLRDHGICQGCKKHSGPEVTLDCHHIKRISEFSLEESEIHSLSNLVSLCPICHASQHQGNQMLAVRASRASVNIQNRPYRENKRSKQENFPIPAKRVFPLPGVIEVHPSSEVLLRTFSESSKNSQSVLKHDLAQNQEVQRKKPNSGGNSITEGLAWIDNRIAETKFQDMERRCIDEDVYCNCDYCDSEIVANPFQMSVSGKFLCDECYRTTGGKE